jgi:hypothetical protein
MDTFNADQVRALLSQNALGRVVAMELDGGIFILSFFPKNKERLAYGYETDRGETRYFKTINAVWVMAKKLGIDKIEVSHQKG